MSAFPAAEASSVPRLRLFRWHYPEWWVVAACSLAWLLMLTGVAHRHDVQDFYVVQPLLAWLLMILAMMLPAVVPQIRRTALGSFWGRRHRAIAGFIVGYLLPWCAAGCVAVALLLPRWSHHPATPVILFLLAAAWQHTDGYRSAQRLCHRTIPLAPLGWRADRDCVRYGALVGSGCVRACFPLMLACAATGHGLVAMVGGCWLALLESWWPRPSQRTLLAGTLALALFYGVSGVPALQGNHPAGMRM